MPSGYTRIVLLIVVVVSMIGFSVGVASATTQVNSCTKINESGSYELSENLTFTNGHCIEITTDNVYFDGMGYVINGEEFDNGGAFGEYPPSEGGGFIANSSDLLTNITFTNTTIESVGGGWYEDIKNGEISNLTVRRDGEDEFLGGIAVIGKQESENILIRNNTIDGGHTESVGIIVGNPFPNLNDPEEVLNETTVSDTRVIDNTVTGTSFGIVSRTSEQLEMSNNDIVKNNFTVSNSLALGAGVFLWSTSDTYLSKNTISQNNIGVVTADEIYGRNFGEVSNLSILNNSFKENGGSMLFFDILNSTVADNTVRSGFISVAVLDNVKNTGVSRLDIGNSTNANTTLSFEGTNINVSKSTNPPDNPQAVGIGRYFDVENNSAFGRPVDDTNATLNTSLHYRNEDTLGVKEDTLSVWRYGDNGSWNQIPSTVDTGENVIEATNVTEFGTFGAFGEEDEVETLTSTGGTTAPNERVTVRFTLTNTRNSSAGYILNIKESLPESYVRDDAGGTWKPSEQKWAFLNLSPGEQRTPSYTYTMPDTAGVGNYSVKSEVFDSNSPTEVADTAEANVVVQSQDSFLDAIDRNDNCEIDDSEQLRAVDLWQNDQEVPNTGGQTISYTQLLDITDKWSTDSTLSYDPAC